jgi:nucleotidyltransferase substrate binding protein (TIGR01987 family)
MKDFYEYQGTEDIQGSRDAIRLAYKRGLIEDGDGWMKMITSRTLTTHTYNEETVEAISSDILERYHDLFVTFEHRMEQL